MEELAILVTYKDVEPHLDAVRTASDSNRNALGFLPSTVFPEYARHEKLLVATVGGVYVGHLLFDRRFPRATVIQMYCDPSHRREGVAKALLRVLMNSLKDDGYLSIKAGVAEDLIEANDFWEKQHFYVSRRKDGGQTTGRKILVRIHELDTPQLFARSGLAVSGSDSLGLKALASESPPMYLVDLNVLFDIVKRRPQHNAAVSLFRAAHSGECRLAISDEMGRELQRNARDPDRDPMLCLIESLPSVPLPNSDAVVTLVSKLSSLIFPERAYPSQLSVNDLSDLRHVATAAYAGLSGFITRDNRVLRAATAIESLFRVQVVSPDEFGASEWSQADGVSLDLGENERVNLDLLGSMDYHAVSGLLGECGVESEEAVSAWLPRGHNDYSTTRVVARSEGRVLGYMCWSRFEPKTKCVRVRAAVDESSPLATRVAQLLLNVARDSSKQSGLALFQIETPPRQSSLREAAYRIGFRATEQKDRLAKVAAGFMVTRSRWKDVRSLMAEAAAIDLPTAMPEWHSFSQHVPLRCPDGDQRHIRLDALETLLSPVLFGLHGRPAVIVPIQPRYSEPLLGHSRQLSLAPRLQVEAYGDRMYIGDPRSLRRYVKGGLVLFYESGSGERAIVAAARIVDVFLIRRDELDEKSLARSVVSHERLSDIGAAKDKAACVFDNIVHFERPVRLVFLRSIGISEARLITANRVSDEQLTAILEAGFEHGVR